MKIYFLIALLVSLVVGNAHASEPRWFAKMLEVKLLEHNYADVLRILGQPNDGTSEPELSEYFNAPEGRYFVYFSSGLCVTPDYSGGEPIGWKVPQYTAISISFTLTKKIKPKKLGLDLRPFRKYEISDVPGAFIFENDHLGIEVGVKRNGFVEIVSFQPPKSKVHLHC